MEIETTRFGRIQVPDEEVIHFPRGLYGLNGSRRYCLLPHDDRGDYCWLQSADVPSIAMLVTDPFRHFPSYSVEIPDPAAEALEAGAATDVSIYTSITLAATRDAVFTNLLGPLLINHRTRLGMQLIQDGDRYSTQHPIGARRNTEQAA